MKSRRFFVKTITIFSIKLSEKIVVGNILNAITSKTIRVLWLMLLYYVNNETIAEKIIPFINLAT